jgi:hypothetical protein
MGESVVPEKAVKTVSRKAAKLAKKNREFYILFKPFCLILFASLAS